MVMGSSLGGLTLKFIFVSFGFGLEYEGVEQTLSEWASKGGWKGSRRINWTLHPIQCYFRFGINQLALGTL